MTQFCVRKAKKTEGRVYAMEYDGPSDDSDDEKETKRVAIITEKRQEDSWNSDTSDNDGEDSDNDYVNKVA